MGQVVSLCRVFMGLVVITFWCNPLVQIYNTAPPFLKIGWTGGVRVSSPSIEHLAEERQMLTAGLTASICPFSLVLLCSDNGTEGTGVLCVKKVDLIACDSPFSRRAWRAISPSLILAWRVIMGRQSPQKPQLSILIHDTLGCLYFYYSCVSTWMI